MVAIDLITEHIRGKLQQHELRRIFHNLEVIPSNFQTRGMHTIVRCSCAARRPHLRIHAKGHDSDVLSYAALSCRDADTMTPDFVFYADRLLRLVSLTDTDIAAINSTCARLVKLAAGRCCSCMAGCRGGVGSFAVHGENSHDANRTPVCWS